MDALLAFEPVGLDEIVACADLQVRTDRKYVMPLDRLPLLLDGLDARVLQIEGRRSFTYRSVYFDTADLASYSGAAHRRRRRFKVRTRTYLDSDESWLEVKTLGVRGSTVKQRVPHTADPERLDEPGLRFVSAALARACVEGTDPAGLRPTLRTGYRRSTLLLPGRGRATVDTELVWCRPGGDPLAVDRVAIVETKTAPGAGPGGLGRRLAALGHRPTRISKYGTGMAATDPSLPANRWHRTLSGALAG